MFKVIFTSITATIIIVSFVTAMFLNSILGIFGLVSSSLDSFDNLRESKQIVDKMKDRHKTKKLNASKKFVKRTSKKIASSTVAAATIGTAAVAITVAGLEVYSYCEDKNELHEDEKILFKTKTEFDFKQCLIDAKKDSNEIIVAVKKAVPEIVGSAWENTKDFSNEIWESTWKLSTDVWSSTSDTSRKLWESFKDRVN